jgi:hypothetical protein
MDKAIAEAWVTDLRSNPPQAIGFLYDAEGYCCLGRLCIVMGIPKEDIMEEADLDSQPGWRKKSTMRSPVGRPKDDEGISVAGNCYGTLADANDAGCTFEQIADAIERDWERL